MGGFINDVTFLSQGDIMTKVHKIYYLKYDRGGRSLKLVTSFQKDAMDNDRISYPIVL